VSISQTFYEQLYRTKVYCTAFLFSQFGFVIFLKKNIGTKAARKMPGKFTLGLQSTQKNYRGYVKKRIVEKSVFLTLKNVVFSSAKMKQLGKKQRPSVQVSISSTFYTHILRQYFRKKILYKKRVRKMLMKLAPGVNFIIILRSAFSYASVLFTFSLMTVWVSNFLLIEYRQKSCS